jgi:broad specificity phosphatase PhoE
MELERSENILIVTHQAVLRCIYAYFMAKDQASSPWMAVSTRQISSSDSCFPPVVTASFWLCEKS